MIRVINVRKAPSLADAREQTCFAVARELLANANRTDNIALARRLLGVPDQAPSRAQSDRAEGDHKDKWIFYGKRGWATCNSLILLIRDQILA